MKNCFRNGCFFFIVLVSCLSLQAMTPVEEHARAQLIELKRLHDEHVQNSERQLDAVISLFNKVRKPAWRDEIAQHFPCVLARLGVLGCSLKDFSVELMSDVVESLHGTLNFKMACAPHGNLQDHRFYEWLTSLMGAQPGTTLYWCECANATAESRVRFVFEILEHVLRNSPDQHQPVVYTDLGEEGCLQTELVAHGLMLLGYRNLTVNIINKRDVIDCKAIPIKVGMLQHSLMANFSDAHVEMHIFTCDRLPQAIKSIKLQPGWQVFTCVDMSEDIDGWTSDEYRERHAHGEQLLPVNAIEFGLALDKNMRKYLVNIVVRRYGNPIISIQPVYPELMAITPMIIPADSKRIGGTIMAQLLTVVPAELQRCLQERHDFFWQDFRAQLISDAPYVLQSNEKALALDALSDLVVHTCREGSYGVFLHGEQRTTLCHVRDGMIKSDGGQTIV